MWNVVDRCLTVALTIATIYLAYSASDSANTARESAESASESAAAAQHIAQTVSGVAESAAQSVATTSKWFELSQRPFVYPKTWQPEWTDRDSRRARLIALIEDFAKVPTTIQKVCIWQGPALIDYDRRRY